MVIACTRIFIDHILDKCDIDCEISIFVRFIILINRIETEFITILIYRESAFIFIMFAAHRCSSNLSLLAEIFLLEFNSLSWRYVVAIILSLSRISHFFPSLAVIEAVFHLGDVICAVRLEEYRKFSTSLGTLMRNSSD